MEGPPLDDLANLLLFVDVIINIAHHLRQSILVTLDRCNIRVTRQILPCSAFANEPFDVFDHTLGAIQVLNGHLSA